MPTPKTLNAPGPNDPGFIYADYAKHERSQLERNLRTALDEIAAKNNPVNPRDDDDDEEPEPRKPAPPRPMKKIRPGGFDDPRYVEKKPQPWSTVAAAISSARSHLGSLGAGLHPVDRVAFAQQFAAMLIAAAARVNAHSERVGVPERDAGMLPGERLFP